ncbi:MAG: hypothetical protein R2810_01090 [Flavobacteriales bacterium]
MYDLQLKKDLLDTIRPQHIGDQADSVGGWTAAQEWIDLAEMRGIGWWITSALESNIGLNAIAQWTATLGVTAAQGLGTGRVFTNNILSSPACGCGKCSTWCLNVPGTLVPYMTKA